MAFILFAFLSSCFITAKYKNPFSCSYNETFLEKDNTSAVNGIFVVLVFMSHFSQYVTNWWTLDSLFLQFNRALGQCIVCTFLFYSGYGMMEQMKNGKDSYLHKLLLTRFPSLWIKFVICVLLYVVLAVVMRTNLSVRQILLSLVGLDSVGNSAWYIFYMLFAYVAIYVSFRFVKKAEVSFLCLFIITALYTMVFASLKHGSPAYYLDSCVLPAGMLFSYYRERITNLLAAHFIISFVSAIILYLLSFAVRHVLRLGGWAYNATAICFTAVILLLTMKIQFRNKLLSFLGNHVFEIYILQRLPMIAFRPLYVSWGGVLPYSYLIYFIVCVLATVGLAVLMKMVFMKLKI